MTDQNATALTRSTPVLKTGDYPRARTFYHQTLGFRILEEGGSPARFGIFERDRAVVFVDAWHGAPPASPGGWDAYLHCEDVDALCRELAGAGARITRQPEDTTYGMREFEVTDPDGNVLCFGTDMDTLTKS
ncbi:VOC family protein [Pelagibius sp.]|uniref:VOC family protein n=1 Tax=Pelagibius sp. TaxID=1931238 RepID=UPI003B509385